MSTYIYERWANNEGKWNMLQRTYEVPSGVSEGCAAPSPAPWVVVPHFSLHLGLSPVSFFLFQPQALLLLLDLEGYKILKEYGEEYWLPWNHMYQRFEDRPSIDCDIIMNMRLTFTGWDGLNGMNQTNLQMMLKIDINLQLLSLIWPKRSLLHSLYHSSQNITCPPSLLYLFQT